ncbi:hypothetical protein BscR1v2_015140 [Bartonella schoenbuchensis R1]|uniref:Uncharacterized protein n=1 Tax=Bartonella schoenbuchensis (strain DSM 13525 / NCTC 13165 / R1) TaxID=687861 RepID=A0A1S6XS42_BARSR|nr:hypothetical protein BscR1v2_015140 [Bartonella schoenbuchensis R1]
MRIKFPVPAKLYTWWSYRARDFALSDRGRRLDHIWSSPDLAPFMDDLSIFRAARGNLNLPITFQYRQYLIFHVKFEINA